MPQDCAAAPDDGVKIVPQDSATPSGEVISEMKSAPVKIPGPGLSSASSSVDSTSGPSKHPPTSSSMTDSAGSSASSSSSSSDYAASLSDTEISPSIWFTWLDVVINKDLFKKGVVAIAPDSEDFPKETLADESKFELNSRSLSFGKPADLKSLRLAEGLLRSLQSFITHDIAPAPIKEAAIISNPKRREEIFLPLLFQANAVEQSGVAQQSSIGSYIYPWPSKNAKDFKFEGFEQFVTAGCMFGSNLRGENQIGRVHPLVKHDIEFMPTEKITRIEFNEKEANPYEEMLFAELSKQAFLIDRLSKPGKEKKLQYHLPYGDYMLFGVELFIRGRMTLPALNQLFNIILKKKEVYTQRVQKICAEHGITLTIESPFDNLFGPLTFDKVPKYKIAQVVLDRLGFSCTEIPPDMDSKRQQELESQFVVNCLVRLQQNTFRPEHQRVWCDFIRTSAKPPQTIEELFKVANASMIAVASAGKPDFATCSLLPLSEKQIQVGYQQYSRQAGNYSGVFNVTTLDPVISYSENNSHGLLFYCSDFNRKQSIAGLISQFGILRHAHENIAHFAQNEESVSLERVLPLPK